MRVTPQTSTAAKSSEQLSSNDLYTFKDTEWSDRDNYFTEMVKGENGDPEPIMTSAQLNQSLIDLGKAILSKHSTTWNQRGARIQGDQDFNILPFIKPSSQSTPRLGIRV